MDGSEFRITKAGGDTNGEYLEMEWFLPPSTQMPPKHIHPQQREDYEVVEGAFEVFVRDGWQTVRAGESASAPAGEVHTFRVGDKAVRVRNVHAPALDFEQLSDSIAMTRQILEETSDTFGALDSHNRDLGNYDMLLPGTPGSK